MMQNNKFETMTASSLHDLLAPFHPCAEAVEWLGHYKLADKAWRECPNGQWMLWAMANCCDLSDVDPTIFAELACDIAELALPSTTSDVPKHTIDTARRFLLGEATKEELKAARAAAWAMAGLAAWEAGMTTPAAAETAWAAAWAAEAVCTTTWATARAAEAAWAAARAAAWATDRAAWAVRAMVTVTDRKTWTAMTMVPAAARQKIADLVRTRFPRPPRIKQVKEKQTNIEGGDENQ